MAEAHPRAPRGCPQLAGITRAQVPLGGGAQRPKASPPGRDPKIDDPCLRSALALCNPRPGARRRGFAPPTCKTLPQPLPLPPVSASSSRLATREDDGALALAGAVVAVVVAVAATKAPGQALGPSSQALPSLSPSSCPAHRARARSAGRRLCSRPQRQLAPLGGWACAAPPVFSGGVDPPCSSNRRTKASAQSARRTLTTDPFVDAMGGTS